MLKMFLYCLLNPSNSLTFDTYCIILFTKFFLALHKVASTLVALVDDSFYKRRVSLQ